MSLAFLRQLAAQPLPLNISDRDGIENVQRLRAAGLIAALVLRLPHPDGTRGRTIARVLAITGEGRRVLRSLFTPVTTREPVWRPIDLAVCPTRPAHSAARQL
ncbi:hypothetical protein [Paracidovorax valerianellae]|uniref:Uncharacterized protein n=1 Tax=Paracidovorax valerianellae TaxID=187868 RepID=A0A1G6YLD1_9BURK|nr:hypothetical protein [Paracidovorax valerianellae]MDA8447395.1 hypothetical protein [Paracidovorax valerianellae]SDD91314.1 hypothetical protein SAMN05192589_110105 [Paracidovorax valerianellae]